jgi:hypothetical protein
LYKAVQALFFMQLKKYKFYNILERFIQMHTQIILFSISKKVLDWQRFEKCVFAMPELLFAIAILKFCRILLMFEHPYLSKYFLDKVLSFS